MKKHITKANKEIKKDEHGLMREISVGKPRYDLIYLPVLKDLAFLLARGAEKYDDNNWKSANDVKALTSFKASAWRHFVQYMEGEQDEAHHAAIMFNISAIEYLKDKLDVDINGVKNEKV